MVVVRRGPPLQPQGGGGAIQHVRERLANAGGTHTIWVAKHCFYLGHPPGAKPLQEGHLADLSVWNGGEAKDI